LQWDGSQSGRGKGENEKGEQKANSSLQGGFVCHDDLRSYNNKSKVSIPLTRLSVSISGVDWNNIGDSYGNEGTKPVTNACGKLDRAINDYTRTIKVEKHNHIKTELRDF
jgi:hypothetical protein